jgi:hypothetical protein
MNTQSTATVTLQPEVLNFLRMNVSAEPYHGLPLDYKEIEGKYRFVIIEDKVSKYHIEKAQKDLDLINKRIAARKDRTEILEGDVIEYLDGHTERVTHVWDDHAQAGGGSGSYYMGESGYGSYSGGLNSGLPLANLELTDKTKDCMFWFFSGNMSGGGRGVYFYCPVKVWKQIA